MKKKKLFLVTLLLLLPDLVFASNGDTSEFPIVFAFGMEAFVSIHMSLFVLIPISKMFSKDGNYKKLFYILFAIRAVILIIGDFINPLIAIFDFIAVFIGTFLIVPLLSLITKKSIIGKSNEVTNTTPISDNTIPANNATQNSTNLKCTKCDNILSVNDKYCTKCGAPSSGNNVQTIQDTSPIVQADQTYFQTEKTILKNMLIAELQLQGENEKTFITLALNTKKNILLGILGFATFIFATMYFFNYSLFLCLSLEIIVLLVYSLIEKNLNIINVLTKLTVKNPNQDISNIVNSVRNQKKELSINRKLKFLIVILGAIIIPITFFLNPKILYIKYEDGYSVLRYTRGIISESEVIIPSTYKGKQVLTISDSAFINCDVQVISLPSGLEAINAKAFYNCKKLQKIDIPSSVKEIRGNAFENCTNLTTVTLHEGLKEIRGGAFKNDSKLANIKLPDSLEYLGGSAFSHCSSLAEITIPKNVTEINGQTFEYCTNLRTIKMHDDIISIHGETFVGDISLNNVILPPKITEIKGNTFEGCSSLTSIIIPVGVIRIGGHAFYGCSSLSSVSIPSTVNEIGSSAFRQCHSLRSIRIPYGALVNEKAFKESPTSIERY